MLKRVVAGLGIYAGLFAAFFVVGFLTGRLQRSDPDYLSTTIATRLVLLRDQETARLILPLREWPGAIFWEYDVDSNVGRFSKATAKLDAREAATGIPSLYSPLIKALFAGAAGYKAKDLLAALRSGEVSKKTVVARFLAAVSGFSAGVLSGRRLASSDPVVIAHLELLERRLETEELAFLLLFRPCQSAIEVGWVDRPRPLSGTPGRPSGRRLPLAGKQYEESAARWARWDELTQRAGTTGFDPRAEDFRTLREFIITQRCSNPQGLRAPLP